MRPLILVACLALVGCGSTPSTEGADEVEASGGWVQGRVRYKAKNPNAVKVEMSVPSTDGYSLHIYRAGTGIDEAHSVAAPPPPPQAHSTGRQ